MKQHFLFAAAMSVFMVNIGFCWAGSSSSTNNSKPAIEDTPNISNEADYAEWVRKNERASQASSVKSKLSNKSSSSAKSIPK